MYLMMQVIDRTFVDKHFTSEGQTKITTSHLSQGFNSILLQ